MVKDGVQTPNIEGNWLYCNMEDGSRYFGKIVYLGKDIDGNDMQPYLECTNKEKEQWEEEHNPEPEPVE